MAGVTADQGHVHGPHESTPAPAPTSGTNHLKVTPENVMTLAQTFRAATDTLVTATRNMEQELRLPGDAFLGDPYSKWAIGQFNDHFVDGGSSVAGTLRNLVEEHKATFNALKKIAEEYGKTDEWNAHNLGEAYDLT